MSTWDLSPLFSSDTDPAIDQDIKDTQAACDTFVTKWHFRTDYLSNPAVLKQALVDYNHWATNFGPSGKAGYYFDLRLCQDQANPALKARSNQITLMAQNIINSMNFFTLNLGKIPPDQQSALLSSSLLDPYHHFLQLIFAASAHQLSQPEEAILTLKYPPSHANWTHLVSEFLSRETRDNHTLEDLLGLLQSPDSHTRNIAAEQLNSIFASHLNLAEHEMNSILQNKQVDDQLRHFPRPDSARHLSDDVPTAIVDTLIQTVSANFSIANRYYQLKAKLLKVAKLQYHERVAPYGQLPSDISFPQAVHIVSSTLEKLDPEFADIFTTFQKHGAYDVYPKPGKRGGAFCAVELPTAPTYILLNHTGKLTDVLTLAHETGHGINNEMMRKTQLALNFGSPLSTAEVASTFFEDFALQHFADQSDPQTQLAILIKKLEDDIATIFRQVAFYNFESELHILFRAKGYLSHQQIGELFQKHCAAYMGEYVLQSPGSQNWWVYVSHFRRFFYVYSYASGLLISKYFQRMVKSNSNYISQVKLFLSQGTSQAPQVIFHHLGADIASATFWQSGITEIADNLAKAETLFNQLNH